MSNLSSSPSLPGSLIHKIFIHFPDLEKQPSNYYHNGTYLESKTNVNSLKLNKRNPFNSVHLTLLCERHEGSGYVLLVQRTTCLPDVGGWSGRTKWAH